jgi:hypothetical protein
MGDGRGAPDLIGAFSMPRPDTNPIRSISTNVSFTSSPVVPTAVRAGGTEKYSFHTSSKAWKLFKSVRNTCALTTLSRDEPAAAKVCLRFSST